MHEKLLYSYFRTESDNKYIIFLRINPDLLEQEVDITLTNLRELCITASTGEIFITDVLTDEIYYSLANKNTVVIFSNTEGDILAKHTLSPMKI